MMIDNIHAFVHACTHTRTHGMHACTYTRKHTIYYRIKRCKCVHTYICYMYNVYCIKKKEGGNGELLYLCPLIDNPVAAAAASPTTPATYCHPTSCADLASCTGGREGDDHQSHEPQQVCRPCLTHSSRASEMGKKKDCFFTLRHPISHWQKKCNLSWDSNPESPAP